MVSENEQSWDIKEPCILKTWKSLEIQNDVSLLLRSKHLEIRMPSSPELNISYDNLIVSILYYCLGLTCVYDGAKYFFYFPHWWSTDVRAYISRKMMIGVWRPKTTEFCPFYSFYPIYETQLVSLLTFIVLMVCCSRYWKITRETCYISDPVPSKGCGITPTSILIQVLSNKGIWQHVFLLFVDGSKAQEGVRISKPRFACVSSRIICHKAWLTHQV